MSNLNGKKVLITGGASGIGYFMAKEFIQKGADAIILWDINKENLTRVVDELKTICPDTFGYLVDVSDLEQVKSSAQQVKAEVGKVDILVNNAGVVVGKYFHDHSHDEIDLTMGINTSALMHITLEFLPAMLEEDMGHIVNISSAAGMVANPQMSVYCASKWAVIGWSDSIRLEMLKLKKNIQVTTVTPYYINTGMFAGVKSIIPIQKPEKAVAKIIRGIENNRAFIRMPLIVYTLPLVKGLLPLRWFDWVVGRVLGIYKTMDHFKGRN